MAMRVIRYDKYTVKMGGQATPKGNRWGRPKRKVLMRGDFFADIWYDDST